MPDLDDDPSWTLRLPVRPDRDQVDETLTTLADGRFGTRGIREESQDGSAGVLAGGIYTGVGAGERLLTGPDWTSVRWPAGAAVSDERTLDLRTGLLARRRLDANGEFRSLRMAAAAHPGLVGLRAEADGGLRRTRCACRRTRTRRPAAWAGSSGPRCGQFRSAASRWRRPSACGAATGGAIWSAGPPTSPTRGMCPPPGRAIERLRGSASVPFTALLAEQRSTWAGRWADGDVLIPDDQEMQLCARFALFHLQASVASRSGRRAGPAGCQAHATPATSSGTRTSSCCRRSPRPGRPRRGRCWSTGCAGSRRPGCRRANGQAGSRFPWESARDGTDVTPIRLDRR